MAPDTDCRQYVNHLPLDAPHLSWLTASQLKKHEYTQSALTPRIASAGRGLRAMSGGACHLHNGLRG